MGHYKRGKYVPGAKAFEIDKDGDIMENPNETGLTPNEEVTEEKPASRWTKCHGDMFKAAVDTVDTLPPAVYNVGVLSSGEYVFQPKKQNTDEVFELPGLPIDQVNARIDKFWESEATYKEYNFVHKTGIILHGPPGNGKSCVIASLVQRLVAQGGVVINVSIFSQASEALGILKSTEPKRRVMTLIEDMDTLLTGDSKVQEQHALSMLDGQAQVNGVVHIATTNYPELLADRFIKRPGRFDMIINMGMPSAITRRAYFQKVLKNERHPKLEYLVGKTEGMALAYLREVATSYVCLGIPVDETLERLQKNLNTVMKPTKAYGVRDNLGFQMGFAEGVGEASGETPTPARAGFKVQR
jgi:hypothetical protein